jgi:hypothetical protein
MTQFDGPRSLTLRNAISRRGRTFPPADALRVAVLYHGAPRRCRNMCAHLERSGFCVACPDSERRLLDAVESLHDVVVVRIDGRPTGRGVRREFRELRLLRHEAGERSITVLHEYEPSQQERLLADRWGAVLVRRKGRAYASLVTALVKVSRNLGQSPPSGRSDDTEDRLEPFPFE